MALNKKKKRKPVDQFTADFKLIEKELKQAFDFSYDADILEGRKDLLRSSSLPYCPLQELFMYTSGMDYGFEESYQSLAYTSMGTIMHELLQNWVPRHISKIKVIGKWDANKIDCRLKKCPIKKDPIQALDQNGCSKCNKLPLYDELEGASKFTSHIDWVILIGDTKRVYIIDIKTTSVTQVWKYQRGERNFPQKPYVAQTDSYIVQLAPMLKEMGYEIAGSMIFYVPRDKPDQPVLVPVRKSIDDAFIERTRKLLFRCGDGYARLTEDMKADTLSMDNIKHAYAHRLCRNEKYYQKNVESKYKTCPLADVCFDKDKSELRKRLKKTMKQYLKYGRPIDDEHD